MDTTFISIHDLTEEAIILYSSDSVVDILGYTPDELVSRSAWEFFPQDEVPYAKSFHKSRVDADKAAVLAYCRVKDKQGQWVGCECCFTVVYDVMVVCTSIYCQGLKSEKRAIEAPLVRRIFSSSPKDPRYNMLSHISAKFSQSAKWHLHEPRACLFLNRFTRTLTIMYATKGLQDVIGIPAESMQGLSFYFLIHENCLPDAVKCLETAKANDSIAYLRFWFRDPRPDIAQTNDGNDDDDIMTTDEDENDSESEESSLDEVEILERSESSSSRVVQSSSSMDVDDDQPKDSGRNSSGASTHPADTHEAIFGSDEAEQSSLTSSSESPTRERQSPSSTALGLIELEAVISCASDGLVVCLRKARPTIPPATPRPTPFAPGAGVLAAPWATDAGYPPLRAKTDASLGPSPALSISQTERRDSPTNVNTLENDKQKEFMNAIRDQAIFAWAITGINGSLTRYGHGKPLGESLPFGGVPMSATDSVGTEWLNQILDTKAYGQKASGVKMSAKLNSLPGNFGQQELNQKISGSGINFSGNNMDVENGA